MEKELNLFSTSNAQFVQNTCSSITQSVLDDAISKIYKEVVQLNSNLNETELITLKIEIIRNVQSLKQACSFFIGKHLFVVFVMKNNDNPIKIALRTAQIGEGLFGLVYSAKNLDTGTEDWAMKFVRWGASERDENAGRSLKNEINILTQINSMDQHKCFQSLPLVDFYAPGEKINWFTKQVDYFYGYLTEKYEGTLRQLVWKTDDEFKPIILANDEKLDLTLQCLDMLETLDRLEMIHQDLRPENILYKKIDGGIQLKLIDFSDACQFPVTVTDNGQLKEGILPSAKRCVELVHRSGIYHKIQTQDEIFEKLVRSLPKREINRIMDPAKVFYSRTIWPLLQKVDQIGLGIILFMIWTDGSDLYYEQDEISSALQKYKTPDHIIKKVEELVKST